MQVLACRVSQLFSDGSWWVLIQMCRCVHRHTDTHTDRHTHTLHGKYQAKARQASLHFVNLLCSFVVHSFVHKWRVSEATSSKWVATPIYYSCNYESKLSPRPIKKKLGMGTWYSLSRMHLIFWHSRNSVQYCVISVCCGTSYVCI